MKASILIIVLNTNNRGETKMEININQISSLDKLFSENKRKYTMISHQKVLRNERFSYQLEITCDESKIGIVSVDSSIEDCVHIYR